MTKRSLSDLGFECEFVEPPPKFFKTECPICLHILREPYQSMCCGNNFCKDCFERLKHDHKPCPICSQADFETFHNKGLQRMLYDFKVHCTHKNKGCEWIGELRGLDKHLNLSPLSAGSALEGCPFSVIDCPLKYAGCEFICIRREMYTHISESTVQHTLLQANVVQCLSRENLELKAANKKSETLLEELKEENQQLTVEVKKLENKVSDLRDQQLRVYQTGFPIGPVDFTMDNFQLRKEEDDYWYSLPFYTHPRGYKMCLGVNANGWGHGNGTHVSVYVFLMQGEFDDQLKWPFQGHVIIQLLDQETGIEHLTKKLDMTSQSLATQRVTKPGKASTALGFTYFITHSELLEPICSYLHRDSLQFRVARVELV